MSLTRTKFGLMKQIRLTNAQILTLQSAPITLLSPIPGNAILPVALIINSNTLAAAYATAAHIQLGPTGSATKWANITLTNSGLDSGAANQLCYQGIIDTTPITGTSASEDVVLSANANPTGGDAANFAYVKLLYVTIPLAS